MRWLCCLIHLHAVWTMPEDDADFATRWRQINQHFRAASQAANRFQTAAPPKANAYLQRRYWEHTIRDQTISRVILITSISTRSKHGLVPRVRDWPYSSFHRMVKIGIYPEDWAGDISNDCGDFGDGRKIAR